jgi:hypothetical protein
MTLSGATPLRSAQCNRTYPTRRTPNRDLCKAGFIGIHSPQRASDAGTVCAVTIAWAVASRATGTRKGLHDT